MRHDPSKRVGIVVRNATRHLARQRSLLIALGLSALLACGADQGSTPAAGSQPTGEVAAGATTADVPRASEPPAPAEVPAPPAPRAGGPRIQLSLEGNTMIPAGGPSTDPFSVIEVEITAPSPFKLKVRVQPELAPDLASTMVGNVNGQQGSTSFAIKEMDGDRIGASLKIERTTFTIAGRPIDVAGKRLRVCGIDLGPLATGDVVTLARGEVRVEDVFRGPLPAPVEVR